MTTTSTSENVCANAYNIKSRKFPRVLNMSDGLINVQKYHGKYYFDVLFYQSHGTLKESFANIDWDDQETGHLKFGKFFTVEDSSGKLIAAAEITDLVTRKLEYYEWDKGCHGTLVRTEQFDESNVRKHYDNL